MSGRLDQARDANLVVDQAAVEVRDLRLRFGAVKALNGLDLDVRSGEVCGLIGPNGAGKSTLVGVITGLLRQNDGEVKIYGQKLDSGDQREAARLGVRFVPQETSLIPSLSVAANINLGAEVRGRLLVKDRSMEQVCQSALRAVGLDIGPKVLVSRLSLAQQRLIMVARALRSNMKVLILDEPTAALAGADSQSVLTAIRDLCQIGVAVILVSHRFDEIAATCSRVAAVRDGKVVAEWKDGAANVDEMVRAVSAGSSSSISAAPRVELSSSVSGASNGIGASPLVKWRDIEAKELRGVTLDCYAGQVVGVIGRPGSGAQEVLDVAGGVVRPSSGVIEIDGVPRRFRGPADAIRAGIGYLSPDRTKASIGSLTVKQNVVLSALSATARAGFVVDRKREAAIAQRYVPANLTSRLNAPMFTLSGGNRQRVLVSRLAAAGAQVFVLNDPTVGVDVRARAEFRGILRTLVSGGQAAVVYSSEPEELAGLADTVYVLEDGRIVSQLEGSEVSQESLLKAVSMR